MNTIIAYLMALVFQFIALSLPHKMNTTSSSDQQTDEINLEIKTIMDFTVNEQKIEDDC